LHSSRTMYFLSPLLPPFQCSFPSVHSSLILSPPSFIFLFLAFLFVPFPQVKEQRAPLLIPFISRSFPPSFPHRALFFYSFFKAKVWSGFYGLHFFDPSNNLKTPFCEVMESTPSFFSEVFYFFPPVVCSLSETHIPLNPLGNATPPFPHGPFLSVRS